MRVEWGVIPVAGRGTRMYPLSRALPKELLPLGRRPVLQHVVEELVACGLRDLVFVTSPHKPAIRSLLSDDEYWRETLRLPEGQSVRFHVVEQLKQIGLGDAVFQSRTIVEARSFVVALGDCVIAAPNPSDLLHRMIDEYRQASPAAVIALEQVPWSEVNRYGIAQLESSDRAPRIIDLIEKPDIDKAPSRWAIAGRYVFGAELFKYLESTPRGRLGEIQLTDAIRSMIRQDHAVTAVTLNTNEERVDVGEFKPYVRAFHRFASAEEDPECEPKIAGAASAQVPATAVGRAFARAGLLGNPSDGYGGKTISLILQNWQAEVRLHPSDRLCFPSGPSELQEFESIAEFLSTVRARGYYSGLRLIQAAMKKFYESYGQLCLDTSPAFRIEYHSDIPRQLGLGGSSAIVIATIRALCRFHQISIPLEVLPSLALSVERDELGIPAGLQDRVVQTYEGLMYMDFSAAKQTKRDGFSTGHYERMDEGLLPPLYVATLESAAEPTEVIHGDLRQRFERGDLDVVSAMPKFAELAERGRQALLDHDSRTLGELMNANFDLRRSICKIYPAHTRMVDVARLAGVSAKFCGSGGAIIGICPEGAAFDRLCDAMHACGASVVRPIVGVIHGGRSANA